MGHLLRRSLGLILAMALVVAGLPMAHAMPAASGHESAVVASSHPAHHCDDIDMAVDMTPSPDDANQPDQALPCKCLNCSMCIANFVAPQLRMVAPEQRINPVIYRIDAPHLAGIAAPIDPGIPILVN